MNKTNLDLMHLGLSLPIIMASGNINFFLGLPLNIFVFVLLIRAGGLDGSLIFTLSQIATEILFALPAPLYILCYFDTEKLCFNIPILFITGICLMSRFLFQCCVCFERYMAVIHPVIFQKYKVRKYRMAITLAVWANAIFSGFINMFWFTDVTLDAFVFVSTLLLGVMMFFSMSLLKGLRRPGPGAKEQDNRLSIAKRKASKVVSINLLMCFIQTVPITMCFSLSDRMSQDSFILFFMVCLNIIILISLLQPVLFLYQNGKLTCRRRG